MQETMKAVVAQSQGKLGIVCVPAPVPGEYECLTKITYCGICNGTDLKLLNNQVTDKTIEYPTVLGHEAVGYIVAAGTRVRNWKVGDRVVSPIGTIAPATGLRMNYGQMAEYGITHDIQAMMEDGVSLGVQPPIPDYRGKLIPPGIQDADAVMLLTFKENYSALKNFGFQAGMRLLVCGDGPVAMGIACIAKALGAKKVVCIGHHDERLEHIRQHVPVDCTINSCRDDPLSVLEKNSLDMIIDAVGNLKMATGLSKLLTPGGILGLYGVIAKDKANLNLFDVPNHVTLHVLNWPYGEHRVHDEVVDLVKRGVLIPSDYYSHVLPMEEVQRGFDMIARREAFKVILRMPQTTDGGRGNG